jgi:hypothetical protein
MSQQLETMRHEQTSLRDLLTRVFESVAPEGGALVLHRRNKEQEQRYQQQEQLYEQYQPNGPIETETIIPAAAVDDATTTIPPKLPKYHIMGLTELEALEQREKKEKE